MVHFIFIYFTYILESRQIVNSTHYEININILITYSSQDTIYRNNNIDNKQICTKNKKKCESVTISNNYIDQ